LWTSWNSWGFAALGDVDSYICGLKPSKDATHIEFREKEEEISVGKSDASYHKHFSEPGGGGLVGEFYSCRWRRQCRIQIAFSKRAPSTRCWRFRSKPEPKALSTTAILQEETDFSILYAKQYLSSRNSTASAFVPHPSACCLLLPLMYPYTHSLGRYWVLRRYMPSTHTRNLRSSLDQRDNYNPILATMQFYRFLQLAVFVCCPFTRTCRYRVDAGDQGTAIYSGIFGRSTQDQRRNCGPSIATVRYRTHQLAVFV
jgi:hypothetical protein